MVKCWVDLPLESVAVADPKMLMADPKMLMADPNEEWKEGEFFSSTHRDLSNQLPVLDVDLMGMVEASVRWDDVSSPLDDWQLGELGEPVRAVSQWEDVTYEDQKMRGRVFLFPDEKGELEETRESETLSSSLSLSLSALLVQLELSHSLFEDTEAEIRSKHLQHLNLTSLNTSRQDVKLGDFSLQDSLWDSGNLGNERSWLSGMVWGGGESMAMSESMVAVTSILKKSISSVGNVGGNKYTRGEVELEGLFQASSRSTHFRKYRTASGIKDREYTEEAMKEKSKRARIEIRGKAASVFFWISKKISKIKQAKLAQFL